MQIFSDIQYSYSNNMTELLTLVGLSDQFGGVLFIMAKSILGSLSNHDDEGNKKLINLHI